MERQRPALLIIQLLRNNQLWVDRAAGSLALRTAFPSASGGDSPYGHSFDQHTSLVLAPRASIIDSHLLLLLPVDG